MFSAYSSMRNILIHCPAISSQVTASNIRTGYQRQIDSFPCITLQRIGGNSVGRLGYLSSPSGYRDRFETRLMQIDIFHADSTSDLELLDDLVIKAIMSSAASKDGFRLQSNAAGYDDTYGCYRATQTWLYNELVQD